MPTFIRVGRIPSDDLFSIKDFVKRRNKGWVVLSKQLRTLPALFDGYLFAVNYPYQHASGRCLTKQAAIALNKLYDSKATCFSYIKEFRDKAGEALGCCPYCGLPSNITLDHYLPRSVKAFPEYSVLSQNLVPACSSCQTNKSDFFSKKSTKHYVRQSVMKRSRISARHAPAKRVKPMMKIKKINGRSTMLNMQPLRFIHPYFDDFILKPVMAVRLSDRHGEFTKVIAKGSLCRWERLALNFHISKLNISYRASHAVRRYKSAIISDFRLRGTSTVVEAKAELPKLYRAALQRAGGAFNSIEAIYIQSLLDNSEMLNELIAESLVSKPLNEVAFRGVSI
ncbi:HNH endonuclease [Pseudomonas monsensis]